MEETKKTTGAKKTALKETAKDTVKKAAEAAAPAAKAVKEAATPAAKAVKKETVKAAEKAKTAVKKTAEKAAAKKPAAKKAAEKKPAAKKPSSKADVKTQMYLQFDGKEYLIERQLKPEARRDIIRELDKAGIVPTAMMDISDGLSSELLHICKDSNTGCQIGRASCRERV